MPVMKQKSIQPARGVPYAEGILMYNGTAGVIPANTLVKVEASVPTGASLNMTNLAVNGADPANGAVPLFITKHNVPVGKHGVVLPWAILTGLDTTGTGLNIPAGDPVYLQDAGSGGLGPSAGRCVLGESCHSGCDFHQPPNRWPHHRSVGGLNGWSSK